MTDARNRRAAVPRRRAIAALIALSLADAACSGERPTEPTRPADCVYFSLTVPRTLNVGETAALTAFRESCRPMFFPLDPSTIAWQSLDPAVLSISANIATGIAPGAAIVQGTFGDMTSQAIVVVGTPQPGPAGVARLRLMGSPSMALSQSAAFTVFEELTNGAVSNVSSAAQWRSSDSAVAGIVDRFGDRVEIHAFRSGSATITASVNGRSVALAVRVPPR
jgi:hypothetical protein